MSKNLRSAVVSAIALLAGLAAFNPTPAQAWWVGPRVVIAPPAYYAPRYYAPPVVLYAPPPPPPYYADGRAYGRHNEREWVHGYWHGGYWVPPHWG